MSAPIQVQTQPFDYRDLLTWIKEVADEVLQIVDQPVTEREGEYIDYLAFRTTFDSRQARFQRLEKKVVSKNAVKITPKMWQELDPKWRDIARRTRMWLWKLDACLPGRLGKFGDYLNQAEEILEIEPDNQEDHIEMADQLFKLLNEHKDFFKEIDSYKEFFVQVKRAEKYEGEVIPQAQMNNLHSRLQVVCKGATKRENLLHYDEFRFRFSGFSTATEDKLKIWLSKLGTQKDVEDMAMDYKDFVQTNNLFANYDKMLSETKKRGDTFRKHVSKEEAAQITQFADKETQKWKTMSAEIKRLQSMFDEGLEQWKLYNGCYNMLIEWITEGEQVMHGGTKEQIEEHFTEIPQYEDRLKFLNESANFLKENCQKPIAEEIKQNVDMINGRFMKLVEGYQHYKKVEVIGKGRQEYQLGVYRISEWLQNAEELLAHEVPCKTYALKDHLQDVDMCGNQLAEMEADFKVTTKTAHSLVKDSDQTMVNEMLQILNLQKEVIVRLRKEIPERIKYIKAVIPNVESLETGIFDLNNWLFKGESLLATHKLDGDLRAVKERLEKHKQFFSETVYQKSIVEIKNKVHQKVKSTKPKLIKVNFDDVDIPMEETNARFQSCISTAKDWDKKLNNLSRLWRVYSQKEQSLAGCLQQAQTVLKNNEDDTDSLIRKHTAFFDKIDKQLLYDYLRAGQDILMVLDDRDKLELQQDMASMQNKWKFDIASHQLADGDPGFTDLGDNNRPQKLGERFAELFDEIWSSAYESLKPKDIDDSRSDEGTMDTLQQIVRVIYDFCQTKSQDQIQRLSKEMIPPVVDPTTDYPKSEGYQAGDQIKAKTGEMVREDKKLEAQATVKLMQMEIFENHIKDKVLKGEEISKELVSYVEQCVDLIWYMCIQQPPMEIRWAVKGDKFNKEQFRFSGGKGKKYRMTVWPAVFLHKHGPVVSQGYALPLNET